MNPTTHLIGDHTASLGQFRRFLLARECEANAGHLHYYDHWIEVKQGRIRIIAEFNGHEHVSEHGVLDLIKPLVKAGVRHTVKALAPNTVYDCVFTHRDFQGEIVQRYIGNPDEAEAREEVAV